MKKTILLIIFCATMLSACTSVKQTPEEKIQDYLDKASEYYDQEDFSMAELEAESALRLSEKEYGKQSKEMAYAHLKTALYCTTFEKAIEQVQLAEKIFENSEDMSGLAKTYETFGRIYDRKNEPDLVKGSYEEALKYCDMSLDDTSDVKFQIYLYLSALDDISQEEAIQYCIEAEKLIHSLSEEVKNEKQIDLYRNMGTSYYNLNLDEIKINYQ